MEKFAGKSGVYPSNRELLSFSQHKIFCENKLDNTFNNITSGELPELARNILESGFESANLNEMRILFIYDNSIANATSEPLENLRTSSQFLGVSTCLLDISEYSNEKNDLKMLNYALDFSPTIIIFALHGNLNQDSKYLLSVDFILKIKKNTGSTVAIVCFDIWRDSDLSFVQYWKNAATLFLHIDPIAVKRIEDVDLEKKFLLWPFPALQASERPIIAKQNNLIFSGSIKEQDRRFWLRNLSRIAKNRNMKLVLIIFNYHKPKSRSNWSSYIDNLSKSLVGVSLTQKSNSHALVTGRIFDVISVGSLVLQQEMGNKKPLSYFYNEYEHYLSFRCLCEIEQIIDWISLNVNSAKHIGAASRKFNNFHYSPERLWKYLYIKSKQLE